MHDYLKGTAFKFSLFIFLSLNIYCSYSFVSFAEEYGTDAYTYMKYLNDNYPDRVQNTKEVHSAGRWLQSQLTSFGYSVKAYSYDAFGMEITNYIATKKGQTNQTIYVGSHYDCVAGKTRGADDNASGVGVNLELAKRFANKDTECTIKFCFWDAEELDYGCAGSYLFTEENMTQDDWDNALLYINLDCVGAGDELYVYGGEYVDKTLTNDWALNMADYIAAELDIELKHIPNCIKAYPTPTRVGSSDHYYFVLNGNTPYIYFEATAWTRKDGSINETNLGWINSKLSGFSDTDGQIMHTKNDNLSVFEKIVPGRVKKHLSQTTQIVATMLNQLDSSSPKYYKEPKTYRLSTPIVSVDQVQNGIQIKWNVIQGSDGYYVYRKTTGNWEKISTVNTTSYIDDQALPGISYQYTVRAYQGNDKSNYKSSPPIKYSSTPTTTHTNIPDSVKLTWIPIGRADSYYVHPK